MVKCTAERKKKYSHEHMAVAKRFKELHMAQDKSIDCKKLQMLPKTCAFAMIIRNGTFSLTSSDGM